VATVILCSDDAADIEEVWKETSLLGIDLHVILTQEVRVAVQRGKFSSYLKSKDEPWAAWFNVILQKVSDDILILDSTTLRRVKSLVELEKGWSQDIRLGVQTQDRKKIFGTYFRKQTLREVGNFLVSPDLAVVFADWVRRAGLRGWRTPGDTDKIVQDSGSQINVDADFLDPPIWLRSRFDEVTVSIFFDRLNCDRLRILKSLWEKQTVPVHLDIRYVSSKGVSSEALEELRDTKISISQVQAQVGNERFTAFDHSLVACQTKHILFTTQEVIPASPTTLVDMQRQCVEQVPVLGYFTQKKLLSSEFLMGYVRELDRIRFSWSNRWIQSLGYPTSTTVSVAANMVVQRSGIKPLVLGIIPERCKFLDNRILVYPEIDDLGRVWTRFLSSKE